mgnify:FL=1
MVDLFKKFYDKVFGLLDDRENVDEVIQRLVVFIKG